MAFRFLLVGAVAALGFDLPQGIDVDALAQSGRAWWHARAAEFEARHGITLAGLEDSSSTSPSVEVEPETLVPELDAAFATVIEDVVASFAADGQSEELGVPETSSQRVAGVDDAAYGPEFADALNRWADGLSEPEDPATLVAEASGSALEFGDDLLTASISGVAGSAFASSIDEEEGGSDLIISTASAVGEIEQLEPIVSEPIGEPRLVKAVQLTGQALQAWFSLIQPASPAAVPAS
ncbi:hypothetical protein [Tautonia rosea]|uniref:hypothetical protein n=1 Tax=Tautonia rosea TaxID=2728037 RepID=UPI001473EF97|nr:hypothetical protein [Tautonia rosea]